MSTAPLIELTDIRKSYHAGTSAAVEVLRDISLTIHAGEFVAIMGQSGSGKSTLMNILGLLDSPTSGTYRFQGQDVSHLDRDELAALRREAFGFVFQQYNLIPTISAVENVEVPATYAGQSVADRRQRATHLLQTLGLGDRIAHRPNELSGGQQQRVSIARALINGGQIILADEPTGALDSASGAQVMELLASLARAGHTVILITHDHAIASAAKRIIEIRDGLIVSETSGDGFHAVPSETVDSISVSRERPSTSDAFSFLTDAGEAFRTGIRALLASPVRTSLTLIGIIIGVASVIALLAIGQGVKQSILGEISSFGANRLFVLPGGNTGRGPGGRLLEADADLIGRVPDVAAVMSHLSGKVTVRAGNADADAPIIAATSNFPQVMMWKIAEGVSFTEADEHSLATVAVIGKRLNEKLFPDGSDPLRKTILVNNMQFQVIGVLEERGALAGGGGDDETIVIPISTGTLRVLGTRDLSMIYVLLDDVSRMDETEKAITATLQEAHQTQDFRIFNPSAEIERSNNIVGLLTLLVAGTAAISLFVGGIGVMNVMLMTVTERTREIGIRMATGARTKDILRQFLTEAMMVSGVGGIVGVILGISIGVAVAFIFDTTVIFSATAIAAAVGCAVLTGLIFGFMPARRAARLQPVTALARE